MSSQCFKRAIRTEFTSSSLLKQTNLSERTKRLVEEIARRLTAARGTPETTARGVATALLNEIGLKVVKDDKTEYLLFLSESEINAAVEVATQYLAALSTAAAQAQPQGGKNKTETLPKEIRSDMLRRLDGGRAADLALFGA